MIVLEWAGVVLMLLGALLSLSAAVGMLVLPDVSARLQAATKPQVIGLVFVVVGAMPFLHTAAHLALLLLVALFQWVTAPILGQLVARAAYRDGAWRREQLVVDDLGAGLREEEREAGTGPGQS